MNINGREISSEFPPYLVAEISCNHGGKLENALALIDEAKGAGADAVKFQCFLPELLTLDCDKPDFILKDGPWKGRKLYDLYSAAYTPRTWFPKLFDYARTRGITAFSSVFAPEDVDFLEKLDCPAYKIASMEIKDTNLIAYAAKTGKTLIISTGMASNPDWHYAVEYGGDNCFLLHCVSGYPTPIEETDLSRMLGECVGISDHSIGCDVAIAATALGTVMIEKHLALPDVETEDSEFSMMPMEFFDMAQRVRTIWRAMQPSEHKSEESSRQLRRSLYVVKDIKFGEPFTNENVRSIRPSYGLSPRRLNEVLRCTAARDLDRGTALTEDALVSQP